MANGYLLKVCPYCSVLQGKLVNLLPLLIAIWVSSQAAFAAPVISLPPSLTVASVTACSGQFATLQSYGCTGTTISWIGNGISLGGPTSSFSFLTPPNATTLINIPFTITCADNTTILSSTTAVVSVVPAPSLTLTASPSRTITEGNSTTLTAAGCQYGTVSWSTGLADQGKRALLSALY